MKLLNRSVSVLIASVMLAGLTACTTTTLATRWNDTEYKGPPLEKVLVVGVMKDDIKRRYYEDEFVKKINAGGRHAVTSYSLMPDLKAVDDKEELVAIVKKAGADSILITTLKAIKKEEREVPPRVDYVPTMGMGYGGMGMGYGGYYGGYYNSFNTIYSPGYTTVDTVVHLETRVYAVETEDLVWAGNTESMNASSADSIISETASIIVNDMKKSGLIK
jgi:hypothetical protein